MPRAVQLCMTVRRFSLWKFGFYCECFVCNACIERNLNHFTVSDLTSTRKIICKRILNNSKLNCDALIMAIFCATAWCTHTTVWSDKASLSFLLYCLTDCFRFWWHFTWGCTPNIIAQSSFWCTLNVSNCTFFFFEAQMKPTEFL